MPRILILSDTHGLHRALPHPLPDADIIVHAGDMTNRGTMEECMRALGWFNALPYKYRICIAGNHDLFLDPDHIDCPSSPSAIEAILPKADGFFYLNDSGCEVEGIRFWGSPVQPEFFHWAYNRMRGPEIQEHWDLIPENTDVLITHGPAYKLVDECPDFRFPNSNVMENVGCVNLAKTIEKIKPKLHICGHIHGAYGHVYNGDTLHVNGSICTENYSPTNKPTCVNYTQDGCNIIHFL